MPLEAGLGLRVTEHLHKMKKDTKIGVGLILLLVVVLGIFNSMNSVAQQTNEQEVFSSEVVGTSEPTVCCEITNSGNYCLNVKEEDCTNPDSRKTNSACSSTAFCNLGYCIDPQVGTCLGNVPQVVCNQDGGSWSEDKPASCNLGCCNLGDQAALTTLVSCKSLSGGYGLTTEWDPEITDQDVCLATAGGYVKGACVFEEDFQKTCKITTRENCNADSVLGKGILDQTSGDTASDVVVDNSGNPVGSGTPGSLPATDTTPADGITDATSTTTVSTDTITTTDTATDNNEPLNSPEINGECKDGVCFYQGILCSAEELVGVNCGPSESTTCLEGKEEVYFLDSCGNPANIYDASKKKDVAYWTNIIEKSEACGIDSNNENSVSCGNCNYQLGSFCREADSTTPSPDYGDYICKSLNCIDDEGKKRIHGESWCATDAPGQVGTGKLPVGSKFFRNTCVNNQIKVEPCAEFRQEECIEEVTNGFSQAACRVNRWQDCTAQTKKDACLNVDRRDCKWMEGIEYVLMGVRPSNTGDNQEDSTVEGANTLGGLKEKAQQYNDGDLDLGACVPANPPGLDFYGAVVDDKSSNGGGQGTSEAEAICAQANAACPVTYTKKKFLDGDDEWECAEHCECLTEELQQKRSQVCMAMGDCGPNVNIANQKGTGVGFKVTEKEQGSGGDE